MTTTIDHEHKWGKLERSTFAGTLHRKCKVRGCDVVNAYDDDCWDDSYPKSDRCPKCENWKHEGMTCEEFAAEYDQEGAK